MYSSQRYNRCRSPLSHRTFSSSSPATWAACCAIAPPATTVWGDFARLFAKPWDVRPTFDAFYQQLSDLDELEPVGLLDEIVFAPPLIKQERYGLLLDALTAIGYRIDPPTDQGDVLAAHTFAYDWRQDMRRSAQLLGQAIAAWQQRHPGLQPWVLACGSGGIVARWYIDRMAGSAAGEPSLAGGFTHGKCTRSAAPAFSTGWTR